MLARHEMCVLLDEDMTSKERQELEDAEEVCRRFLAWKLEHEQADMSRPVRDVLTEVLGREPNAGGGVG